MPTYESGGTPLGGRYLVKNVLLRAALTVHDAYLGATTSLTRAPVPPRPKRILVVIGGQLGDAVVATSAIHQLRLEFPDAEIGVACPPVAVVVLDGLPGVARVHRLDHWFWGHRGMRRSDLLRRWSEVRHSRAASIAEIAAARYEVGIDLYPFFPSAASALAGAGIPVRIGYASGGGGPLLTHAVDWEDTRLHVAGQHTVLMARHWPGISARPERYGLPSLSADVERRARALLRARGVAGPFAVLHPGTSAEKKRWPVEQWRRLIHELRTSVEAPLVFTGHGPADQAFIDAIRAGQGASVSVCNDTDWSTFRWIAEHAEFLVTADSVAGHVSGGAGVPTIVIAAGMSDPLHWKPLGPRVDQLMSPVACAPCFLSNGCAAMRCVREVDAAAVVAALRRLR